MASLNDFGVPENSTIIGKNSKIPCQASQIYGTVRGNQSAVDIEVLQGDAKDPDDCVKLGIARMENLPASPADSPVEITFSYDADCILHVTGVFSPTGQSVKTKIEVQGSMSPEEAQRSKKELQNINVE